MDNYADLERTIREILDRNSFINQKIDLSTVKQMNPNVPVQDAFRIRVMSPPLRFSVEIVKPLPLKDFLFIAGRLNIAPDHLAIINKLELNKRLDLFDEIRIKLTDRQPNFKYVEGSGGEVVGVECMISVFISKNEEDLAKQLFAGMDEINKCFFLVIIILQRFLRNAGFNMNEKIQQTDPKSFYQ